MISEELITAIIEDNIQKVHAIIFKEMDQQLSDEYYIEALEISNKHQRSSITDYIQLTRLYRLLDEKITTKAKSARNFHTVSLLTRDKFALMLREILKQLYKFYDCKTNKLTALHSTVAAKKQFSLYATRNHLGEYQVVIHKKASNEYYQLSKEGVVPYNNVELLTDEPSALLPEQEANDFMARIKAAQIKFSDPSSSLPLNLKDSITKDMLLDTYAYILKTPNLLEPLTRSHSVRIDKHDSALQRTCNILLNESKESKECLLMLETKRKKCDGTKDPQKVIGEGSYGTVKPAWRIDSEDLEEWANKTTKEEKNIFETEYESNFSRKIIASCTKEQSELFNHTIQSEVFYKKKLKHSQYSKRAIADLKKIEEQIELSLQNKLELFGDILNAIDLMHQKGKIHQDIKPANILIYKGEQRYYAKLTDFGISEDIFRPSHNDVLSTRYFASPEILIATKFESSPYHKNFHSDQDYSFTYRTYLMADERSYDENNPIIIDYRLPHPSNDMWALGILLFTLLYNRYPKSHAQDRILIENDPLLRGLLNANRQQRMTTKEAKEMYPQWVEKQLTNVPVIAPLYESSKSSASSSSASSADQNELYVNTLSGRRIPLSALFKKNL